MTSSELTDAECEAMLTAMLAGTATGTLGETVWLAARDYYKAERERERDELEELAQKPPIERKPVDMPGPSDLPHISPEGIIMDR